MLFDIKGKNAIVTGASRGIGYGIAEGFAEAGANLICICRSMPEEVLEEFRSFGVRAEAYSFDLSEPEKIPALVEKILSDWERIDILVNNAGAQRRNNCADFTDEDWDFVMNVNAKSVFVLCREVGRHMVQRGSGKIVNFASLLSFQGGYRVPAYSASKGAVMQFTKTFANEWAKLGGQRQLHRAGVYRYGDERGSGQRSRAQRADYYPHPRGPLGAPGRPGRRGDFPLQFRFGLCSRHNSDRGRRLDGALNSVFPAQSGVSAESRFLFPGFPPRQIAFDARAFFRYDNSVVK